MERKYLAQRVLAHYRFNSVSTSISIISV